jgi:hypothetical protein
MASHDDYAPGGIAARTLWIIPEDDHPLLRKTAAVLKDKLSADPALQQVVFASQWPSNRAPDFIFRLRLNQLQESDGLLSRQLNAVLGFDFSTGPHLQNTIQPTINYHGTFATDARLIGDGLGAAHYQLAAPHLAEALAKTIRDNFDDWRKKLGTLPDLPPALYPDFRPAQNVDFLKSLAVTQSVTGHGLLSHNESLYRLQDSRDPKTALADLAEKIKKAGWILEQQSQEIITAHDDSRHLKIERVAQRDFPFVPTATAPATPPKPNLFDLQYSDPMTDPERAALWDQLVRDDQWRQAAPYIQGTLKDAARDDYIKRLESAPNKSSYEFFLLSHAFDHADRPKAIQYLERSAVMARFEGRSTWLQSGSIRTRARALGIEKTLDNPPSNQTLHDIPIPELPALGTPPLERTLAPDQCLCAFARTPDGNFLLISASVSPDRKLCLTIDNTSGGNSSQQVPLTPAPHNHAEACIGMGLFIHATADETAPAHFRVILDSEP